MNELPNEILLNIFEFIERREDWYSLRTGGIPPSFENVPYTCRNFYEMVKQTGIIRKQISRHVQEFVNKYEGFEEVIRVILRLKVPNPQSVGIKRLLVSTYDDFEGSAAIDYVRFDAEGRIDVSLAFPKTRNMIVDFVLSYLWVRLDRIGATIVDYNIAACENQFHIIKANSSIQNPFPLHEPRPQYSSCDEGEIVEMDADLLSLGSTVSTKIMRLEESLRNSKIANRIQQQELMRQLEERHQELMRQQEERHQELMRQQEERHQELIRQLEERHQELIRQLEERHQELMRQQEERHQELMRQLEERHQELMRHQELIRQLEERQQELMRQIVQKQERTTQIMFVSVGLIIAMLYGFSFSSQRF